MYVYSRGGPHSAPAPRPSLIYCALPGLELRPPPIVQPAANRHIDRAIQAVGTITVLHLNYCSVWRQQQEPKCRGTRVQKQRVPGVAVRFIISLVGGFQHFGQPNVEPVSTSLDNPISQTALYHMTGWLYPVCLFVCLFPEIDTKGTNLLILNKVTSYRDYQPYHRMCLGVFLQWLSVMFPNANRGQFRALAQAVSRQVLTAVARVRSQVMWDLCWTKWHWGWFPPSTSVSPTSQFSFHRLLHTHHRLLSGASTIGQLVANVPSGLSFSHTPRGEKILAVKWSTALEWRWRILFHVKPEEPVLLRNRTSCFCMIRVCGQRQRQRARTDRYLCFVAYFATLIVARRPDWPWTPHSLLFSEYQGFFPGDKTTGTSSWPFTVDFYYSWSRETV
jgi:hypothetical protein